MKRLTALFMALFMGLMPGVRAEEAALTLTPAQDCWTAQLFAMDTFMQLTVYDPSLPQQDLAEVMDNVLRLEKLLSATEPTSEVSALNASWGAVQPVSSDTRTLLQTALAVSAETQGAFDVTAFPLVKAWGFTQSAYRVPQQDELTELLEQVDYRKVLISDEGVLLPEGMQIDLGGIGKGYTGDVVMQALREKGVTSALMSLGGNIAVLGRKTDGSLWKIAVRDPQDTTQNIGYVQVEETNVVTSGGYERYFEDEDGNIWWHIIDPETGYPARNGLLSVTVIGPGGARCDALSTALFVMGTDEAMAYLRGQTEVDAILIDETGRLIMTSGLRDRFTLMGANANREIVWIE